MRVLSLFSGGGLGDYGLELAGMEIIGQVEIDDYCQKILKLRWPDVPKWTDIKNVTGKEIIERCGTVDLISGGFPCQPFSVAGSREGETDKRHLWPEMHRIICEVRPKWVLAENVSGLLSISNGRVFGDVVRNLAESGYCVEWDCIPASAVGAPHQRDRVWVVAYSNEFRCELRKRDERQNKNCIHEKREPKKDFKQRSGRKYRTCKACKNVADATSSGCEKRSYKPRKKCKEVGRNQPCECRKALANSMRQRRKLWSKRKQKLSSQLEERIFRGNCYGFARDFWTVEPDVGRVAHGTPNRMDRLKLLGNGQVVQVVQWIGERIMEFHDN